MSESVTVKADEGELTFFRAPRWRCTRHGVIGSDIVRVDLDAFSRTYCARCFVEALERVGVSPAERIE